MQVNFANSNNIRYVILFLPLNMIFFLTKCIFLRSSLENIFSADNNDVMTLKMNNHLNLNL